MDDYEELLAEQEEEQLAEALADEHQAELEVQLEQDEQPPQIAARNQKAKKRFTA